MECLGVQLGEGQSLWVFHLCWGYNRADKIQLHHFFHLDWPLSGLFIWVRQGHPAGTAVPVLNPFPIYSECVSEQQLPLPSCCSASPERLCEKGLK